MSADVFATLDLHYAVMSKLDAKALACAGCVCREWAGAQAAGDTVLWRPLVLSDWSSADSWLSDASWKLKAREVACLLPKGVQLGLPLGFLRGWTTHLDVDFDSLDEYYNEEELDGGFGSENELLSVPAEAPQGPQARKRTPPADTHAAAPGVAVRAQTRKLSQFRHLLNTKFGIFGKRRTRSLQKHPI